MKNPEVKYVSKSKLFPAFGEAIEKSNRIDIRKDLPEAVKKFVLEHEKYHLRDWKKLKEKKKKVLLGLGGN